MPSKVTLVFSTGRRYNYFYRTSHSLLVNCTDLDRVSQVLIVDHGSSQLDIQRMLSIWPKATFISWQGEEISQKWDTLFSNISTNYAFLMQDDWEFVRGGDIISLGLKIMEKDEAIKQVWLRYFPCPVVRHKALAYRLHMFRGDEVFGSPPDDYDSHWPGFTLNPSITDIRAVKALMPWPVGRKVERAMSLRWHLAGYRVAHTLDGYVKHIGTTTAFSAVKR